YLIRKPLTASSAIQSASPWPIKTKRAPGKARRPRSRLEVVLLLWLRPVLVHERRDANAAVRRCALIVRLVGQQPFRRRSRDHRAVALRAHNRNVAFRERAVDVLPRLAGVKRRDQAVLRKRNNKRIARAG